MVASTNPSRQGRTMIDPVPPTAYRTRRCITSCVPKAAMKSSVESRRVRHAIFIFRMFGVVKSYLKGLHLPRCTTHESADCGHLAPTVDLRRRNVCSTLVTAAKRVGASDGPVRRPHRDCSPRLLGDSIGGRGLSCQWGFAHQPPIESPISRGDQSR